MWPLLLGSLLAVAVFVERLLALRSFVVLPKNILVQFQELQSFDRLDDDQLVLFEKTSVAGALLSAIYRQRGTSYGQMSEAAQRAGRSGVHAMEKYIEILAIVAAVSPLLGILGTVTGMIDVFAALTADGNERATQLARGISQALITTASGIVIAVPTLVAHRYLLWRIEKTALQLETLAENAMHWLQELPATDASSS